MSEDGIAEELLHGSENIDLMRKRITQVLSMVFGLVSRTCEKKNWQPPDIVAGLFIKGPSYDWVIRVDSMADWYVMYASYYLEGSERTLFSTNGGSLTIPTEDVQGVYESLDAFVEGMIKEFPMILVHGLKPFTRAADVKL